MSGIFLVFLRESSRWSDRWLTGSRIGFIFCFFMLVISLIASKIQRRRAVVEPVPIPVANQIETKSKPRKSSHSGKTFLAENRVIISLEQKDEYAFLEITNSGPEAEFWARLEATNIQFPDEETFARWDHSESCKALIPTGQTRRLRIGWLKTVISRPGSFPGTVTERGNPLVGSWHVPYCTSNKKVGEAQPFNIGPQGPVFDISVSLFADPELRTKSGSIDKRIKFVGNSAIER